MIEYGGNLYQLHPERRNSKASLFIADGAPTLVRPKNKKYIGYIAVDGEIIEVYKSSLLLLYITIITLFVMLTILSIPRVENREYRVSFNQQPLYEDGVLYCNVVNVSDLTITVQFTNSSHTSTTNVLSPGECLAMCELDFLPSHILYNNKHSFPLEVRND